MLYELHERAFQPRSSEDDCEQKSLYVKTNIAGMFTFITIFYLIVEFNDNKNLFKYRK